MGKNDGAYFVEWQEGYVSQEKGGRIVHYILKDSCGKSVLAVVGTERSLRHMVYVVAEDFLSYYETDNPVQAGFKWRSRREVVDWLTSMLAQQQQGSPSGDSTHSLGSSELLSSQSFSADRMNLRVKNLKQSCSDVVWIGASWTCGKQLNHYPSFCRNGTTIAVQSFVFVMAKEGSRYVAYLEDMYEDKKRMKKVKVRWFHHSQEVKGIVRLRNAHPKEVYITPYTQVISVECVDGPAIVLTREHFEKCLECFPDRLLGKLHLCCRQFRSNKIKPFDLSKLRGYVKQPIISCLESDTFLDRVKFGSPDSGARGAKRTRSSGDRESFLTNQTGLEGLDRKRLMWAPFPKNGNGDFQRSHIQHFKVDDKIEILCQDSGIRGCWFRCIVLEIARKQMKLQYRDIEDQDGCGNLEEWVPAFRLAAPDKLGMRCLGRPTVRPSPPNCDSPDIVYEVGAPVDAWWSDGWWEGVVTAVGNSGVDNIQVYAPGEKKFLDVHKKDLRVSRDWLDGNWVDVKVNPGILLAISMETKQPVVSTPKKDDEADDSALETKLDKSEEKLADLSIPSSSDGHPEQVSSDKNGKDTDHLVMQKSNDTILQDMPVDDDDQNIGNEENDGPKESEVDGIEIVENDTQGDEAMELTDN